MPSRYFVVEGRLQVRHSQPSEMIRTDEGSLSSIVLIIPGAEEMNKM